MENIRKKGFIGIIVCLLLFIVLGMIALGQDWKNVWKEVKEISNIVELEHCKEGDWIRLTFHHAYETDYWYEPKGEQVARFIDIEVNGHALIALVEKQEAQRIIESQEEEMCIEGVWQTFSDENMKQGYENIKRNYLMDFEAELSEEEILDLFTSKQLLSYGVQKPNAIFLISLVIAIIGTGICLVIAIVKTIGYTNSRQERARKKE